MTVFNAQHSGNATKLFLGESLGLMDTINVPFPKLVTLREEQDSLKWNEFEVSVVQDRQDMLEVDAGVVDAMVKTVGYQWVVDSSAGRSIQACLAPFVSNTELEQLFLAQSYFEGIHARTYSHIVKQTFINPQEALEEVYENTQNIRRAQSIIDTFDELGEVLSKEEYFTDEHKKCAILKGMTALFALEAIGFMASFAVTFAIAETKVFQGIGKLVKLICRDEQLHARMDYEIFKILQADVAWAEAFSATRKYRKQILDDVVQAEMEWADYLFTEGREVIGLNANLLKEYVAHQAKPVYDVFKLVTDFEVPTKNPLKYMEKYTDSGLVQTANQEIENDAYKVDSVIDDTDDLDLGEF